MPHEASRSTGPGAHPIHFEIERLASPGHDAVRLREKSTFVVPR
jgi:hypothetical protein